MSKETLSAIEGHCVEAIDLLGKVCHEVSRSKGWWQQDRNDGECVALMHSELSELLEGLRHGDPASEHIPEFSAVEEEAADVIIRLLEWGHARGLRFGEATIAKIRFNMDRPHKHGGKAF